MLFRARWSYAFLLFCCLKLGIGYVQPEEDKAESSFCRDTKNAFKGFTTTLHELHQATYDMKATMEALQKSSAQLTLSYEDIKESVDKSSQAILSRLKDIEELSTNIAASNHEVKKELEKTSSSINSIAREQTFLEETLATVNNLSTEIHKINREDGGSKCSASIEAFLKDHTTWKETLAEKNDQPVEKNGTCEDKPDGDKAGEPNNNCDKDNKNGDPDPSPPRDCTDIYENGNRTSGVYNIQPKEHSTPFPVLCKMEEGAGWTVIQERGRYGISAFYFAKPWDKYRTGFGEFSEEFWLGNDKIAAITGQGDYEVWIDLWDKNNDHAYARYNTFKVGGESTQYRLRIGGYSGTAGDALSQDDGVIFSTGDRRSNSKCYAFRNDGWWHGACGANPNGVRFYRHDYVFDSSLVWVPWKGEEYYLVATTIKVKPIDIKSRK